FVSALPIDRNAVCGFDREYGHVGLLKCESPVRWPGYAVGMVLGALDQAVSRPGAANGSTSLWIGCARPIQGSGLMQRTQSAKLGTKPRSSMQCCSPIGRTGTTRPVESVIVGPKKRSSMKIPSA